MILFKTARWKNFLSTGDKFTEIQLNKDETTLIVGHNGAGKSTILDAISFALFGKPHRNINKPQLINSINNKNCVVEVEFQIGQGYFKVVRGIKPNVFEIWKNGTMINQSSHAKEYQRILEQNILKLNHKSFHQVVVLGSSSFIPFMQLPSGHRRDVIEDLLDINVFSKMNMLLREQTNTLKEQIKDINYNIDIQKNKIETQSKYIRDITALTEENKKEYESRIQESKNSIDALQAENSELSMGLEESIREAENGLQSLQDRKQSLLLGSQDKLSSIRDIEKRITFFQENGTCPVCDQAISDGHKHEILSDAEEQKRGWKSALKTIGEEGTQVEKKIGEQTGILTGFRNRLSKLSENNREIDTLHKTIQGYQQSIEKDVSADLNNAKADLDSMKSDKDSLLEKKINLSEQYNYNSVIG
jgi:DNA repair exonuclease SbcCD ATPase subunit